jgi:UrcA family protein
MTIISTSSSLRAAVASAALGAFTSSLMAVCTAAETDTPQTTVKYADLDLSNPAGAVALYARIQQAARQVCSPLDGRDLTSKMQMASCVHKAIARAVAKVDQPALFDAYNARNGRSTPIIVATRR